MNIINAGIKELTEIIQMESLGPSVFLRDAAAKLRDERYGKRVFVRGLIELTNYCKNNCLYCGIRAGNIDTARYRLSESEVLGCVESGYNLGFHSFVIQGGEDTHYTDDVLCRMLDAIKSRFGNVAVTLSLGERTRDSYQALFNAGADRYLLRHETADPAHYSKLHPRNMTLSSRINCLYDLKEIGYQVGAGFMVGSPYQTLENLAADLEFLRELEPHMVGIGPFIPSGGTPFAGYPAGNLNLSLAMLALTRLILPDAMLPATTALATLDPKGREMAILHGANVVMPNISPVERRADYALYDNKAATGAESAEGLLALTASLESTSMTADFSRGDHKSKP